MQGELNLPLQIVSCSGGKDSTAMLLMLLEKNYHIDEIIFCDTTKEFPAIYKHIEKLEKYINRPITIIKAEHDYDYYFSEHIKQKGKRKGQKGYGWPNMLCRWCTSALKIQPTAKYLKDKNYINYIGIAYDEPNRHKNIPTNVIHPLYDWKITEKQALQCCYEHGFDFDGLYEEFNRLSCWCCPLKNQKELLQIYMNHKEIWEQLKIMDNKAYNLYKGKGIEYYENKFKETI